MIYLWWLSICMIVLCSKGMPKQGKSVFARCWLEGSSILKKGGRRRLLETEVSHPYIHWHHHLPLYEYTFQKPFTQTMSLNHVWFMPALPPSSQPLLRVFTLGYTNNDTHQTANYIFISLTCPKWPFCSCLSYTPPSMQLMNWACIIKLDFRSSRIVFKKQWWLGPAQCLHTLMHYIL